MTQVPRSRTSPFTYRVPVADADCFTRLLQIEDLGLKTLDEDDLIALLEGGSSGVVKRESSDEEAESRPKSKKQKR
jgi:hypothetical protein